VRPIGLQLGTFQLLHTKETIRTAVQQKAGRYGELVFPYIIAVNVLSDFVDRTDEVKALFGDEQWPGEPRVANGVWRAIAGPQNTRVSGVAIFERLEQSNWPGVGKQSRSGRRSDPESIGSNGGTMAPITPMERRKLETGSKQREARLRRKYPEVHGKVVDFISHTIDDGTLYFTVRFTDQTSFCVRYACDMFPVGIELSDWQSGDFHIIREYMKPIPR
jgi:hypothetical protein